MKLERFRVTNFRSISDSNWVECDNITTLLGLNESGKTNLLLALLKFNPFKGDNRNLINQNDFPNNINENYSETTTFIACEFSLTDKNLIDAINKNLDDNEKIIDKANITISKKYSGEYIFDCNNQKCSTSEINSFDVFFNLELVENFKKLLGAEKEHWYSNTSPTYSVLSPSLSSIYRKFNFALETAINKIDFFIKEGKNTEPLIEAIELLDKYLKMHTSEGYNYKFSQYIRDITDRMKKFLDQNINMKILRISKVILPNIPKFLYYYYSNNLRIPINLKNYKSKEQIYTSSESQLVTSFFKFLELDPNTLLDENKSEKNVIKDNASLKKASKKINEKFKILWPNQEYKFDFNIIGSYFIIDVNDSINETFVDFNSRGIGIQWFLSFLISIATQTTEKVDRIVILLDETGHSLHTSLQKKLIDYLEELSGIENENTQIIYSTHSPFMINMKRSERLRKVVRDKKGFTVVTDDFAEILNDEVEKNNNAYPIHAALGLSISETFLNGYKIVIVEGYSDKLYLEAIEFYLTKISNYEITNPIAYVQANGAKKAADIASLLTRDDLPIIILDSDNDGETYKKNLIEGTKSNGGIYEYNEEKIISVGEFTNVGHSTIEDLFPTYIFEIPLTNLANQLNKNDFNFEEFAKINDNSFVSEVKKYFPKKVEKDENGKEIEKDGFGQKEKTIFAKFVKKQLLKNNLVIDNEYIEKWKNLFDKIINN